MDERLERLEKFEKRAGNDLIAIHHALQSLSEDLKSLSQAQAHHCSADRILTLEQECELHYNSLKMSLSDINLQQSHVLSSQSQIKSDLEMLKSRFADFEEMFLPALRELQVNVSVCLIEKDQSQVLVPALLSNFEKKIMAHIDAIPKPEKLDLSAIKNEILEISRSAIDESKAAHNKTITNQSRLHILEKKVAKLYPEGA